MAKLVFHAFYFDSFDKAAPAARTAIIEADNEDDAGRIAVAQMGRALRVDVTRPVWGGASATPDAAWRSAARGPALLGGAA
jgi:hypothetical protein